MPLAYENATSGKNALNEIQRILRDFGAKSFGSMENFDTGELLVQFEYRDRKISVKASAKGYAAAWLKHHPWSNRMRCSQFEHERKAVNQGMISVYSILRDWIKGQVTAIETGILSFEGAFLGQILLPTGKTVMEEIEQHTQLLGGPKT
jgi:hypothetical protein